MKIVFLSCSLVGFVSAVFKCCSDILQGEKIRSEKVAANFLISTSVHIFRAFATKNSLCMKKFVLCKSGLKERNSTMQLRDAECTYTKIKEYVGMQSTIIVDASLFADIIHRSDPLLQETPISVLDSNNFLNALVATEKYEKRSF